MKNFFIKLSSLFAFVKNKIILKIILYILAGLVSLYVLTYVGFIVPVYKYHNETKLIKTVVKVFPYPATWVGGKIIWVNTIYQEVAYVDRFKEEVKQPVSDRESLYQSSLEQNIQKDLLLLAASREGIKIKNSEVEELFQKELVEKAGGEAKFQEVVSKIYGLTVPEFKKLAWKDMEVIIAKEKIQNDLLLNIQVAHILIKDEKKAKEILERVKKGEDFTALAKEFSEDTGSRDQGGDLGWVNKGMMVADFENAAFGLKPGEVSDLVKTEFGYHIIKVGEKRGQLDQGFNDWFNSWAKKIKVLRFIYWKK
jgi:hypothetical protein